MSNKGKHALHERANLPTELKIDGYYVYGLYDNDDIFYVGKGKGNRYKGHFNNNSLSKSSYKNHKIKAINNSGRKVNVRIIAKGLSERESLLLEGKLIESYGLHRSGGCLTNIYAGDWYKTSNGYTFPEERRKQQSISLRGKNSPYDEDTVKRAKLLFHYRGMTYKEISELPEFSKVQAGTIKQWCNKSSYAYLRPDLKSHFEIRDEQMEECYALWQKGWLQKQVGDILGLPLHIVKSLIQRKQKLLKGLPVRRQPLTKAA